VNSGADENERERELSDSFLKIGTKDGNEPNEKRVKRREYSPRDFKKPTFCKRSRDRKSQRRARLTHRDEKNQGE
jgi:hypothetical protein